MKWLKTTKINRKQGKKQKVRKDKSQGSIHSFFYHALPYKGGQLTVKIFFESPERGEKEAL